jgi:hypothetical protein
MRDQGLGSGALAALVVGQCIGAGLAQVGARGRRWRLWRGFAQHRLAAAALLGGGVARFAGSLARGSRERSGSRFRRSLNARTFSAGIVRPSRKLSDSIGMVG